MSEIDDLIREITPDAAEAEAIIADIKIRGACNECGIAARWRHSDCYCRRCHRKNGYRDTIGIDLDRLDELVGHKLADEIAAECKPD